MASSWCEKQDMQPDLSVFFVLIELDIRALKVKSRIDKFNSHTVDASRLQSAIVGNFTFMACTAIHDMQSRNPPAQAQTLCKGTRLYVLFVSGTYFFDCWL